MRKIYFKKSLLTFVAILIGGSMLIGQECNPVENLEGNVEDNNVFLTWEFTEVFPDGTIFESFEGEDIPAGWEVVAASTMTWAQTENADFVYATATPVDGEKQMSLYWGFDTQNEWLISPLFTVPEESYLSFWTFVNYGYGDFGDHNTVEITYKPFASSTINGDFGDHNTVEITTDNGETWTVLWDAAEVESEGENHYAEPIILDLSAYGGADAKLAWHGYNTQNFGLTNGWCIDAVKIAPNEEKANRNDVSFNIYRSGELIGTTDKLFYVDQEVQAGTYNYCVEAVCAENVTADQVCLDVTVEMGIKDSNNLSIYPNPVNDIVNIDGVLIDQVYLYNNIGKLVLKTNNNQIDVSAYPAGIYILNIITTDGNSINAKIVVK